MAVSTGKRKRQNDENDSDADTEDDDAMRALFQRAFEAQFKPLERSRPVITQLEPEDQDEDSEIADESDWSGLSESEDMIVTVRHDASQYSEAELQRRERKAFMSSKPPSSDVRTAALPKTTEEASEDDRTDAANIKHDLALQRLLKESHLFDAGSFQGTQPTTDGKNKIKALDLRLKDLGSKNSTSAQQKMPLSHRKGITAKAADREERRRKDASENGVVLEKFKPTSRASKYREKGVGGPAIGKFKGSTLKLNSRDLRSIQGVKQKKRK